MDAFIKEVLALGCALSCTQFANFSYFRGLPLPLKPRQPLLPGQQLLHQPFLPLLAVLKQALGGGYGLIPGGEDLGDLFLFGEGGSENFEASDCLCIEKRLSITRKERVLFT